jgi:hypothetical protein
MAKETTRVQVPLTNSDHERVSKLAAAQRRSLGAMCVEMIEHALNSDHYKQAEEDLIKDKFKSNAIDGAVGGIDLDRDKLRKLMKLLEAID